VVRELRVPARTSSFYFKGKNEAIGLYWWQGRN
jgi:hypothetical protein